MSTVKNSFLAFGVAAALSGSVVFGIHMRDRVDTLPKTSLPKPLIALREDPAIPDISEIDYFSQMAELLKREYVDPIQDEQKLAIGAIRGMVNSLEDPKSVYMDPKQFRVFLEAQQGRYEGIGAEFIYDYPEVTATIKPTGEGQEPVEGEAAEAPSVPIPAVVVAAVAAGGAGERAGLKVGDIIDTIDGRWIINGRYLDRFRKILTLSNNKELPAAKREQYRKQVDEMRNELRKKSDNSILPMKAVERLMQGSQGTTKLKVARAGKFADLQIEKSKIEVPLVRETGDSFAVQIATGTADQLRKLLPDSGVVTLDLRQNGYGSLEDLQSLLALFAPNGTYGGIGTDKQAKPTPLEVKNGLEKSRPVRLIVDDSTRGAASAFARALKDKGIATWVGKPNSDSTVVEIIQLPDKSGFTLATGKYVPLKSGGKK